ncbi:ABC transporter permease [Paenibacillus shunpengii]|uniref:ABC transporter permease n=1 Tax=Paenibacillus shunpengii TaxID=2054424 RepID=A0ABW5SN69_9BACL|nr:ABC transporter permease [Paenibacillus sp. FSL H7-0326]OMC67203.1 peptide ABC transporter permease [Paenibacillus sp. FSL H7-0326]
MAQYILRKFISMVVTLWLIITITFLLMHSIPGSPFDRDGKEANANVIQNMMSFYHLDEPLYIQYFEYMKSLLTLDLGPSISHYPDSVNSMIERGFPVSFQLGIVAICISILIGILLGTIAALQKNGIIDHIAMILAVIGVAIPSFVLAPLLIKYIAVELKLLPVATWGTWKHMVLPALALAAGPIATIARLTRANLIEVLTQDYMDTARSKGLPPLVIVVKHGLRNAVLPVITLLGVLLANVLTGSFVIEKIFAIPGMGKYFVDGINNRDYSVIMGTTVFYSALLIMMMFLVDILYGLIDPRIKLHKKGA